MIDSAAAPPLAPALPKRRRRKNRLPGELVDVRDVRASTASPVHDDW